MSNRRVCTFYNKPGGCRRGASCHFLHETPSATSSRGQTGGVASASAGLANFSDVPKGFCIAFWTKGECYKGFQCRYKHTSNPSISNESSTTARQASSTTATGVPASLAPFLTNDALARLTEPGSDVLFSPNTNTRTPSDVHNLIKRFLFDDYRFRHVLDIYAFASLLTEATTNNTHWVSISQPPSTGYA